MKNLLIIAIVLILIVLIALITQSNTEPADTGELGVWGSLKKLFSKPKPEPEPEYQTLAKEFIQTHLKSEYQPSSITLELQELEGTAKDYFISYYDYEWKSSSEKFLVTVGYEEDVSAIALRAYSILDCEPSSDLVKKYFNIKVEPEWNCKNFDDISICRYTWITHGTKLELEQMKTSRTILYITLCKTFKGSERYAKGCFVQI